MTKIKHVSAIILNTNKPNAVLKNVESLLLQKTSFVVNIIVVDNSGKEKNKTLLKKLAHEKNTQVIFTNTNGYSYGNNKGAQKAKGEVFFIINPDIILTEQDTLQKMTEYLEKNTDIAILGPKQKKPDGSIEPTARRFPTIFGQLFRRTFLRSYWPFSLWVKDYEYREKDYTKTQEVDWLQSSFWAVQSDFWKKKKGLDEKYFVFMSDVEMCWQAKKDGKKVVYFPHTCVRADGVRCSDGKVLDIFSKKIIRIHAQDILKYYWKRIFP